MQIFFFLIISWTNSGFVEWVIIISLLIFSFPLISGCPVNFEFLNYTIITSQCKGPRYTPKLCCGALKEFACPYAEELNDLTNDCASTMFSYINLYGKYPPGLFASECREGKEGLACDAEPPSSTSAKDTVNTNRGQILSIQPLTVIMAGLLTLLFQLFWRVELGSGLTYCFICFDLLKTMSGYPWRPSFEVLLFKKKITLCSILELVFFKKKKEKHKKV